jgi:hypothetical protein
MLSNWWWGQGYRICAQSDKFVWEDKESWEGVYHNSSQAFFSCVCIMWWFSLGRYNTKHFLQVLYEYIKNVPMDMVVTF